MLKSSLEHYDWSEPDDVCRSYEWLRDRLRQAIRIHRRAENKRQLEEAVGDAPRGRANAAAVPGRQKATGNAAKAAAREPPSVAAPALAKQACYMFCMGKCHNPCPDGREHRKLETDEERQAFKTFKQRFEAKAAGAEPSAKAKAKAKPKAKAKAEAKARSESPAGGKGKGKVGKARSTSPPKGGPKACYWEAKAPGSCTSGSECKFSHAEADLKAKRATMSKKAAPTGASAAVEMGPEQLPHGIAGGCSSAGMAKTAGIKDASERRGVPLGRKGSKLWLAPGPEIFEIEFDPEVFDELRPHVRRVRQHKSAEDWLPGGKYSAGGSFHRYMQCGARQRALDLECRVAEDNGAEPDYHFERRWPVLWNAQGCYYFGRYADFTCIAHPEKEGEDAPCKDHAFVFEGRANAIRHLCGYNKPREMKPNGFTQKSWDIWEHWAGDGPDACIPDAVERA
ncbi:MAG: hypothetical protein AAGK24_03710, partial [Planctomycetota bacterium]